MTQFAPTTFPAPTLDALNDDTPYHELDIDTSLSVDYRDPVADNVARAGYAWVGVSEYANNKGMHEESAATAVSDLLADVRHLCDRLGLSFDELSQRGEMHYTEEIHGA
ncbi:Hypothetical protein AJAP_28010 [Amycolatopsis japonica]|uniref:Uncharacterized protein n=1 Tax=Amycolatopsis japonica TaxID=208439 RepID=A0A075V196_9PSEU|nr:hypothetical protein [Amycolatopsis japonica]AIG78441.1 Hypothetical protein AJAP_28010 [Amycolatopsis japonica]